MNPIRRTARLAAAALALALPFAVAAAELVFAVTEGVTYQATKAEIAARFQPAADVLARVIRKSVRIVVVESYQALRDGLDAQQYDLAFVHPAHVALYGVRTRKYLASIWTTGYTDYTVSLLVNADSKLKSFDDLRGRTIVSPDPDSITAVMLRAMVREAAFPPNSVKVITTRYQDAVPFYVEYNFADAGATAARAVVKAWTAKGGRVLVNSRSTAIKQVLISTKISPEEEQTIVGAFVGLTESEAGRRALASLGYQGFVRSRPAEQQAAMEWLGI